jgi:NAD(P)-dependent dehydrogenase (short-subunit alcohol dehydrogenase family)
MTEMTELMVAHPKLAFMFANSLPVEQVAPADISNAVVFLACDDSRYVTALTLAVDAGNTAF